MGTSSSFRGQGGRTPLVPSWLDNDSAVLITSGNSPDEGSESETPMQVPADGKLPPNMPPLTSPLLPPIPPIADPTRFSVARSNFSRFARSGGSDRKSLGRAVSSYIRSTSGGPHTAAVRMGSARITASRVLSFLSEVVAQGEVKALQVLNLGTLAGHPIEEIFLSIADIVCPEGGSIDEGIARDAFIETITDLASAGITNLDELTVEQMQTVFELYATNAIEARLCNDIGTKTIILPSDMSDATTVQAQLHDFIQRAVSDILTKARLTMSNLNSINISHFVDRIYKDSFEILQTMADLAAEET